MKNEDVNNKYDQTDTLLNNLHGTSHKGTSFYAESLALKECKVLKGIGEKFTVNAVNGTAELEIALPLTTSPNGLTPVLSLRYNSRYGNSEFGLGWSLSLPFIQRKTAKQLPRYDDGCESDIFFLAGIGDLVLFEDSVITVTQDHPATTYFIKQYRPVVGELFERVEYIYTSRDAAGWWKLTTKDNITTFYGLTAESRISDPENNNHAFRWLPQLVVDHKGNIQQYHYKPEDFEGVEMLPHERSHLNFQAPCTNLYLKSIQYANRNAVTFPENIRGTYQPDLLSVNADFLMEAVLDYGEHDLYDPQPGDSVSWTCRKDPFSDFRSGFEIRTWRKCRRVLMFHLDDKIQNRYASLVSSLDVSYQHDAASDLIEADSITALTPKHYIRQGNIVAPYDVQAGPSMTIAYEPLLWNTTVKDAVVGDSENGLWEPTGNYPWMNICGDEEMHIVNKIHKDDYKQAFITCFPRLCVNWDSPFTQMLDLTRDGKPDLLLTDNHVWPCPVNNTSKGYDDVNGMVAILHRQRIPRLLFQDALQSIFLADMNGDGLIDLVRIRNGEVCYWASKGYGKFGAKITMANAPRFDHPDNFNPRYLTMGDISGTGAADLIYLNKTNSTVWINLAGNGWGLPYYVNPVPSIETHHKVGVMDLRGNGTGCIVWSDPMAQHAHTPMRYIDLMGGRKPYLLKSYKSNNGKKTELSYKSTTRFYLLDQQAAKPWSARLPFPVHCLSRFIVTDNTGETIHTQIYRYHQGYYDPETCEFQGFGMVEIKDIAYAACCYEEGNDRGQEQPEILTKTWYHTGNRMQEHALPDVFAGKNIQEPLEAYQAVKGMPLRQEVYILDGSAQEARPYRITRYPISIDRYSYDESKPRVTKDNLPGSL